MFAVTVEGAKEFYAVEFAVAIGVAQAMETGRMNGLLRRHGVEIAPHPREAVHAADRQSERAGSRGIAGFTRQREAIERAVLVGSVQAAGPIRSEGDPRALRLARDRVDFFYREPGRGLGGVRGVGNGKGKKSGEDDEDAPGARIPSAVHSESGQQPLDEGAVHIGQTEIAALVAIREALVVEAE